MKNSLLLSVLTPEDLEYLHQHMEVKSYRKNQTIFTPMDRCDHLSMIIEGQVKLCKYTADGKEQILSFLGVDDVFGEAVVFEGGNYVVNVVAEEDCKLALIHRDVLLELTQRNKDFTQAFFQEFTRKIKILNNKLEMLSLRTMKQRIARFLLSLSKEQGKENKVRLPYSKQKIAFLLGTSREVISRNFSELEEEGYIIQKGRKTIILNRELLEELLLS
jgi:CRP-like cAMP-binding protein